MAKRTYKVCDLLTAKAHLESYVPYLGVMYKQPHRASLLNRVQNMIMWIDSLDNYTDRKSLDHANQLLDICYELNKDEP